MTIYPGAEDNTLVRLQLCTFKDPTEDLEDEDDDLTPEQRKILKEINGEDDVEQNISYNLMDLDERLVEKYFLLKDLRNGTSLNNYMNSKKILDDTKTTISFMYCGMRTTIVANYPLEEIIEKLGFNVI